MCYGEHAIARAAERYDGLALEPWDVAWMVDAIERKRLEALELAPRNRDASLYGVRFRGEWLAVAYRDGHVVSVLPRHELIPHRYRLDFRLRQLIALGREPAGTYRNTS